MYSFENQEWPALASPCIQATAGYYIVCRDVYVISQEVLGAYAILLNLVSIIWIDLSFMAIGLGTGK